MIFSTREEAFDYWKTRSKQEIEDRKEAIEHAVRRSGWSPTVDLVTEYLALADAYDLKEN